MKMETLERLRLSEELELPIFKTKDTDAMFISTDIANQYMIYLIQEKNAQGHQYAMTEGIIIGDNTDETVEEVCDVLNSKYQELIESYPTLEGIYTVANATPEIGKGAHQNWLFYDVKENHITRLEPNGPYFDDDEAYYRNFRFYDLLVCMQEKFNITWSYSNNLSINNFAGCRATSTILALMHLMGIDISRLSKIENKYYRSLAIIVSDEIYKQVCMLEPLPRKPRRTTALMTYVAPGMVVRGDEEVPVLEYERITVAKLKNYLRKKRIPFTSKERKPELFKKALAAQDSMVVIVD